MLHYNLEYLAVVLLDDLVAFPLHYCLQPLWYGAAEIVTQSLVVELEIRRQDALIPALNYAML